jgi:glutathione peroxidase
MSNVYDIPVKRINGEAASLADYRGKVLLVVNVASKCGLTPQYEGLEKLYEEKRGQGLEVLGFPANNFKQQEPGTDAEIQQFCSLTYDVQFPMFSKISVNGADQHPLYTELKKAQPVTAGDEGFREKLKGYGIEPSPRPDVLWNFEKFLVNRKGEVVARFSPDIPANDPRIVQAIDAELAKH